MSNGTTPPPADGEQTLIETLGENPLALLAGGVALGVLIGVLFPRLAREREVLAPVGKQLAGRVGETARAAREAAEAEIKSLLPDRDATRERVSQLIGSVLDAAKGPREKA